MSNDKEDTDKLTLRERELAAIGAAIASNCVPCIEYHIPLGRKVGLSDLQIREAIELADKVRKVPADKVLQTAHALLEVSNTPEPDLKDVPCGCPDTEPATEETFGCGRRQRDAGPVHLDNPVSEADNEVRSASSNDRAGCGTKTCGSEKAEKGQRASADKPDFDYARMMEMMRKCCPEKMKDFSSMMDMMGGCCSKVEGRGPRPSGTAKSAA